MLIIWSPASVTRLKVSTPMKPRTTVPLGAFGVKVSVMVRVWPAPMLTGVYVAFGSTLNAHTSPLLADTAESNGLVLATAARFTVPLVGEVNGPVASGMPKKKVGATSGAATVATELLPNETPSTSGLPKFDSVSRVIGTVPCAATSSWLVPGGTSQFGWAVRDSGSGTLFTSLPSSSWGTWPSRRASAKKSFLLLPELVMVMVAVTGWPAGSTVLGEFGTPLLLTDGAANEIEPVNGSLRCAPSPGPDTLRTRVHRPGAGVPRKNCMVGPNPRKLSLASNAAVDWMSSGWPFGSTRNPFRL